MKKILKKKGDLIIGMVQMLVCGGEQLKNIENAEKHIEDLCCNNNRDNNSEDFCKPDIIVLPECMNLGWTHPSGYKKAENIPNGITTQRLIKISKKYNVFICFGIVEKDEDKNRIYNTAVIIDPNKPLENCIVLKHRKLNELEIAIPLYSTGDRLNVCDVKIRNTEYRLGLMICADAFSKDAVIPRSLGYMGCDIILSPTSWAVTKEMEKEYESKTYPAAKEWSGYYIPVCKEFFISIVGVSNVGEITDGPWKGRRGIGNSLAIDYSGKIVKEGKYDIEENMVAQIEIVERPTSGCGWKELC